MCASRRSSQGLLRAPVGLRRLLTAALAAMLLVTLAAAQAQRPPAPPGVPAAPSGFVTDLAGVLPPAERAALEADLRRFRDSSSNEIAVLIAPRLPEGQALEDYVNTLARAWGIGSGRDNGVLIAIFLAERKARIEVGYGLEPAITDARAGRIIRQQLRPAFQQGAYGAGLRAAVAELQALAQAEIRTPAPRRAAGRVGELVVAAAIAVLIIAVVAIIYFSDRRSYRPLRDGERRRRDEGYSDVGGGWFFWGGHWGGHSGGGGHSHSGDWGGGGSDFGGFGGGDFGGGGASGDW